MKRLLGLTILLLAAGTVFALQRNTSNSTNTAAAPRKRVIQPANYKPTPLPLSPAILVGDTLYMSGATGGDPVSGQLVQGGFEAEFRQVMTNLQTVLKSADMNLANV